MSEEVTLGMEFLGPDIYTWETKSWWLARLGEEGDIITVKERVDRAWKKEGEYDGMLDMIEEIRKDAVEVAIARGIPEVMWVETEELTDLEKVAEVVKHWGPDAAMFRWYMEGEEGIVVQKDIEVLENATRECITVRKGNIVVFERQHVTQGLQE
ncbi:hypothetical protein BDZ91DRAFT_769096 [Kalaharituber pfeilii]|nr:hypothetical protein BDZ91DRAFT_769096 [Kalaharituber pfeilii]